MLKGGRLKKIYRIMIQNMRMVTLVKLVKIANLAKTVWTILAIIVTRHNLETSF